MHKSEIKGIEKNFLNYNWTVELQFALFKRAVYNGNYYSIF